MRVARVVFGVAVLNAAIVCQLSSQGVKQQSKPAAASWAGRWNLDKTRSKLAGQQDRIEAAPGGGWKLNFGAVSVTLLPDGADHPGPFGGGGTAALTVKSAREWQIINKMHGKLQSTDRWMLSADGKTMTRVSSGTRANGETFSDTMQVKRVSGTSGFAGTWESTVMQVSIPEMVIADVSNGFSVTFPADQTATKCTFDGKPQPVTGPTVPAGAMFICAKLNSGAVSVEQKINGTSLSTSEWTLSPNGKTLTLNWHDAGQAKPIVYVFTRP